MRYSRVGNISSMLVDNTVVVYVISTTAPV